MRARPIALTALLSLALPLAGCDGGGAPGAAAGPPALTREQARAALDRYQAAANQAGQRLDARPLNDAATGSQLAMEIASLLLHRASRSRWRPFALESPTFYIPRLSGHPRWFAASATTGPGQERLRHALLFVQDAPNGPWRVTADPYPAGEALRDVALDEQGYATAVPAPGRVGEAHAAVLSGAAVPAGAVAMADGPQTGQAYTALGKAQEQFRQAGVTLTSRFTPTRLPAYALRTKSGGTLVWYVLQQHETYRAARPGRITVAGDLTGLARQRNVRTRLDTTVFVQYLTAVPRKGPALVVGAHRKAVRAVGS
ncbi:hypothetical protein DPM19_26195 [Actinomadura craniellae]|uniref:DUF8094 domain-containing protein n=1 Tax=Actinomadura craniellae TaxID=2231787 RepID=A0A365GZE7_9ACTN|nr:hypothetical protein [Actinomadura craniellae]RAY12214.1 hypothetical protein DPM19_26195 [Actinomadura craniellae]